MNTNDPREHPDRRPYPPDPPAPPPGVEVFGSQSEPRPASINENTKIPLRIAYFACALTAAGIFWFYTRLDAFAEKFVTKDEQSSLSTLIEGKFNRFEEKSKGMTDLTNEKLTNLKDRNDRVDRVLEEILKKLNK